MSTQAARAFSSIDRDLLDRSNERKKSERKNSALG